MSYSEFRKQQPKAIRCAVCGKNFSSQYDEDIGAFPIYHPIQPQEKKYESCEHRFYKSLLRIYMFLNHSPNSVTLHTMVNEFDWLGHVLMKKEMIGWCLSLGFLALDNLSRIEMPKAIFDPCQEIFAHYNLSNDENVEEAIEILKAALYCFKDELKPVDDADIEKNAQIYHNKVSESKPTPTKSKSTRMHTINTTGAAGIAERKNRTRTS